MTQATFPYTLANLAGGTQPLSKIDSNFNVTVLGDTVTTQNNVPIWGNASGTYITTGLPTTPASGTIAKIVGVDASNKLPVADASNLTNVPPGVIQNYISGLTLANDGVTPNSVLDIATGTAADSTNATMITLASAFTKSTAGTWVAGTGANGMGTGLTIANSTWYHVFAIVNTSAADIYFDTSLTAANKPAGTTAFRRIGSFKTDGSAHILAFTQTGNLFQWAVAPLDGSAIALADTTAHLLTLSVAPGVKVEAIFNAALEGVTNGQLLISSPDLTDAAASLTAAPLFNLETYNVGSAAWGGQFRVLTNTSAQIRYRSSAAANTFYVATLGWVDIRGMV